MVSPTARVRDKLDVPKDERVICIKRLLSRAGEAIFYHSEYLVFDPARPLVEAELGVTSLQDLFSAPAARVSSTAGSRCTPLR